MSFFAFVASGGLHFSGGFNASGGSIIIDVRVLGISATAVGNYTVNANVQEAGTLTASCQNKGGNIAQGQGLSSIWILMSSISHFTTGDSNGNATATIEHIDLVEDSGITAREAGCPNGGWSVEINRRSGRNHT